MPGSGGGEAAVVGDDLVGLDPESAREVNAWLALTLRDASLMSLGGGDAGELAPAVPRGPRSGADVGREVLAGEGGAGGDEVVAYDRRLAATSGS